MSEPFRGPIGLILRRPALCLALAGSFLVVLSLFNLSVIWLIRPGSTFVRPGVSGWGPTIGFVPLPVIVFGGVFGLAAGTPMLIAAGYLCGQRTKPRLFGCALVGLGLIMIALGLFTQQTGWLSGILLLGPGGVLLRRTAGPPAPPGSQ